MLGYQLVCRRRSEDKVGVITVIYMLGGIVSNKDSPGKDHDDDDADHDHDTR